MSVKNFKFVSPGVFINEIDNSFIPKTAQAIGPVVIGRAGRGLAMQPVQVSSYADFVEMFGDTVPGRAGGDIYRNGNYQSPMYGTYAAKAFLNANVAPLTYVRLLGQQTTVGGTAGADAAAGWKTTNNLANLGDSQHWNAGTAAGGAYGLWVFPSGSGQDLSSAPSEIANPGSTGPATGLNSTPNAGVLAAIFYMNSGSMALSGAARGGGGTTSGSTICIGTDSNKLFTLVYTDSSRVAHKVKFGFDDDSETFIRKRFNTNPQLLNASGTFYPLQDHVFLGESFENTLRSYMVSGSSLIGQAMQGVIYGVAKSGSVSTGPQNMKDQPSREAVAGWFIGQDLSGDAATYKPAQQQKLFRLKGRGHGEWLNKNAKVSIEKVKISTSTTTQYGTFSVVIRSLLDTDNNVVILERFDNCTLDPTSPNYVARIIGDKYYSWDQNERRLKEYGEYPNESKFVYVEMNEDVDAGASDPLLLPFGYFGPPTFEAVVSGSGFTSTSANTTSKFVIGSGSISSAPGVQWTSHGAEASGMFLTGGNQSGTAAIIGLTASLYFPVDRLRISASAGGLTNPTDAYFGFSVTRTSGSTRPDPSVADWHRLLYSGFPDDPVSGQNPAKQYEAGVQAWSYVFSLDDVRIGGNGYFYQSGSRAAELSVSTGSYENLLNNQYNRFTAPFWGGFDGFDIQKPDPLYNAGMGASVTEDTSYAYHTYVQAIDSVADPEFIDMNLLSIPGLTHTSLTGRMIDVCEDRADSLALIDLPDVYIPSAEAYYNTKAQRIATTPQSAATALRNRRIDSSYGCTFYPWVQTRDAATGRLLWIPPTVAMLGVLASSQKSSELWFAPAGFNRGGLSDGAAGIPITAVTERLTSKNRDTLYDARINPIATFPSSGIVVFGQKTLQERQSALDRINVRRLVIYLKKQISILSTQVLFEQNVQATWNRFKSLIEPLLANTKANFGITDYRLILDETTTTPDLIDQNILYAKIMVKPARAIEYIAIDFVIASTGASFDD
jgi:hypothetical protein|tara:strand:+ start:450 stop:3464 length:3015 start_codon:yes stop_codon:yes gene_type:complete